MPHSQPLRHNPPSAQPKVDKLLELRHMVHRVSPKLTSLPPWAASQVLASQTPSQNTYFYMIFAWVPSKTQLFKWCCAYQHPKPSKNCIICMLSSTFEAFHKYNYLHAFWTLTKPSYLHAFLIKLCMPHNQPLRHNPPSAQPKVDKLLELRHMVHGLSQKLTRLPPWAASQVLASQTPSRNTYFYTVFSRAPSKTQLFIWFCAYQRPKSFRKHIYLHAFVHFRNLP